MPIYYLDHKDHGTHICYSETDIEGLKKNGWVLREEELIKSDEPNELDELKAKADALGIKYHHKSGVEKLKKLIAESQTNDDNS